MDICRVAELGDGLGMDLRIRSVGMLLDPYRLRDISWLDDLSRHRQVWNYPTRLLKVLRKHGES